MNNFDNFYGSNNFDGSHNSQIVVEQSEQLVCHSESIEIIQQRLVILQEMAKKYPLSPSLIVFPTYISSRIITEQICDVETQAIVFEQFHSSMGSFSNDLRRRSGHQVGYDAHIASHFGDIISSDGSISINDLGFQGHDVGRQTIVIQGNNWDGGRARSSVESAYSAARSARS